MTAAIALAGAGYYLAGQGAPASGTARGEVAREFMHVHGLGVDPQQPEALWVATHRGLIRVDASGNWAYVGRARPDLMGFSISPSEQGVLYSSGHPGPGMDLPNPVGLIVSRNGGRSWQPVSLTGEVDFHALTVSAADPKLLFAWFYGDRMLYRSEDGGRSWTRLYVEELLGSRGQGPAQIAAHPADRRTLLAATDQGLMGSSDSGKTWQLLLDGNITAAAYGRAGQPEAARPYPIVAYQVGEGLVRSTDGGQTWRPLNYRAGTRDAVGYIAVHPADPQTLYIATYGGDVLRTQNGGFTWETLAAGGRAINRV